MTRFAGTWSAAMIVVALLAVGPGPVRGQRRSRQADDESASLMREATAFEGAGKYAEAEKDLRRLLDLRPGSEAGIFALERVLRKEGKVAEVLPAVDRYLELRPNGLAMRQFQLQLLSELDSLSALDHAARDWIHQDSSSIETYRTIVKVYRNSMGPERTLAVIREARDATEQPNALALEAGDVLAASGDRKGAGREWSRAVGEDDRNLPLVLQRVQALSGNTRTVVEALLDGIEKDGADSPARLQGAARLALAAGLQDRTVDLAQAALPGTQGQARTGFLVALAQNSEERGATKVAIWAYERLREVSTDQEEETALDQRIAKLALAAGDTATAMEARGRLASSLPAGSDERRRALAGRLELEVDRVGPREAVDRVTAFRKEFPDAPELDALAARLAVRLLAAGDDDLAARVLIGVQGPHSALERSYTDLLDGKVESGMKELDAGLAGLTPIQATDALELLTFLETADPEGAELAGKIAALAHRGRTPEALDLLRSDLGGVPKEDRPALLALGARAAEHAGDEAAATSLRARLVQEYPDAAQTPEAAVRLAESKAGTPAGDKEAVRILEDLILRSPDSAVAPQARRELDRIRARIPRSDR